MNVNKSYAINYKDSISHENSYQKENEENISSSRKELKESLSKKKNIKYNDIDLNTLFSKSTKKSETNKFNKQNINDFELEEENGGNLNNNDENENNKEEVKEEEFSNEKIDENASNLKQIEKINNNKIELNLIEIKETNSDENKNMENENNDLIDINKQLLNKITELKKEMEFTKREMRKKDEKLLIYVNKYDKIDTEKENNKDKNENLEEELINKQDEIDSKSKKNKELTNKNIDLEQDMNKIKINYKRKGNLNDFNKKKYKMKNKDLDKTNEEKNKKEISIKFKHLEENINYEDLSIDELHNERNVLIKERDEMTILYDKLPIKLVTKEQINLKTELEKNINIINNKLMKIRLQIKSFNQWIINFNIKLLNNFFI